VVQDPDELRPLAHVGDGNDTDKMDEMLQRLPLPIAIVDPQRHVVRAANDPFFELVAIEPATGRGVDVLDLVPVDRRRGAQRILAFLRSGVIDYCYLHGQMRKTGGEEFPVHVWVGALNARPPVDRVVVAAVPGETVRPPMDTWLQGPEGLRSVFGTLSLDFRFIEVSADAADVLGWDRELLGASLSEAVHPADVADFLLVVARSAAERRAASARLRVRGAGGWIVVRCTVIPLEDRVDRFAVGLSILPPTEHPERTGARARRLEGHLLRIAYEVQAAGIGVSGRDTILAGAALWDLTDRESAVLQRLIRGERTAEIAEGLFVSESTVRNHLSAVYRKVGVKTKSELVARILELGRISME
jgi:DNA-binding CsgD family transcriptional regulator